MLVARFTLAALLSALSLTTYAGEAEDIQQLLRAKQYPQAIERADKYLAKSPKDAQVRFLRAIALTEAGRNDEAIKAFTKISEDYPHLPEPYNNLAVLYANNNQFDKARSALQMAIQTNPSYAIAHENMGDLYARLASQAYDKALQIENNNTQVQTKLKLVSTLFNPNQPPAKVAAVATPTTSSKTATPTTVAVAPIKATAAPALILPKPQLPAATIAPTLAATIKPTVKPTLTEVPKAATAKPVVATEAPSPTPTSAPKVDERKNDREQVTASVQSWANAWSKQNVGGYVGSYAKGFKAPGGRAAWEKDRQQKIAGPKSIDVKVNVLKIDFIDDDTAKVKLRQDYKSDRLSSSTVKTLVLQKSGNRWLILEERIGG
ncbi:MULTISPECIES: tetratricopeptide repeat protein [Deefgea]|uniref:Tetratricopeptide repeat protein n=1 Tax=Deefgea chitinilytica TaxID=570276 RepID=A0ABS2CB22_9NEIS|nr:MULTISPECIES: tetratricopeptide repeat protein [Deefgea]MBM5571353.1 tetratricopeptide repeat protein [Deefgea chitinilytica]MBM9888586.1 tetratricopeptide repeat protein [Deefgea sp. CFH1-16]